MSEAKLHVKKGDKVMVLSGKDKGKTGAVIQAIPKKGKAVVEGINKVKRQTKPSQSNPQGGIIVKEAPVHAAKLMLVCPACDKATRVKSNVLANGGKVRVCKKCGETIDKDK